MTSPAIRNHLADFNHSGITEFYSWSNQHNVPVGEVGPLIPVREMFPYRKHLVHLLRLWNRKGDNQNRERGYAILWIW